MQPKTKSKLTLTHDGEATVNLPVQPLYPALNLAFKFTEQDLLANQNGQFAEKQFRKISRITRSQANPYSLTGVIASLAIWIALSFTIGITTLWYIPIITGVFFGIWYGIEIYKHATAEMKTGVWELTGKVQKHPYTNKISVDKDVFTLTPAQYNILMEDVVYTFYYTQPSYIILSIEYAYAAKI